MMPTLRNSGDRQSRVSAVCWLTEREGNRLESPVSDWQVAESIESPMVGFARTAEGSLESLEGFIQFRIEIPWRRTKDG
jgi:hypothetical protein